ncbi:MAG: tol-pal system YbgF family protein [Acidobacteriota bacterium]
MSHRLTRHDIQQKDGFVSIVERTVTWIDARRKAVLGIAGGVVMAAILVALGSVWVASRSADADRILGEALTTLQTPVLPPGQLVGADGQPGFTSSNERDEAALKKLDEVVEARPFTRAATLAAYMRGAALLRLGRADEARKALLDFTQDHSGSDLLPLAHRALSRAEMADGHPDEALRILEALVDHPSAVLPIDAALMELARAQEEAGQMSDAAQTYQRIANEFPESVYSGEAGQAFARLSTLTDDTSA